MIMNATSCILGRIEVFNADYKRMRYTPWAEVFNVNYERIRHASWVEVFVADFKRIRRAFWAEQKFSMLIINACGQSKSLQSNGHEDFKKRSHGAQYSNNPDL